MLTGCDSFQNPTLIGKWQIFQEDLREDYKLEFLEIKQDGTLIYTVSFPPYSQTEVEWKLDDFRDREAIHFKWLHNWYDFAHFSISLDNTELTLNMTRDDRVIRYTRVN